VFADENLARRIQEHLRRMSRLTAAAAERLHPSWSPTLFEGDAVHAMFTGDGSPLTKSEGSYDAEVIRSLREFYRGRTAQWEAAITPFAREESITALLDAGARCMGWENTLYRSVDEPLRTVAYPSALRVERVTEATMPEWRRVSREGFFGEDRSPVVEELGALMAEMEVTERYLAFWEDHPAAAAVLHCEEGVAFLGGAATLAEYRNRGLQAALLDRRLQDSRGRGDFAFVGTLPGSASQRNAERAGFRVAFTQASFMVPVT
jgi:GNAT superfamily N-acetyltransferase